LKRYMLNVLVKHLNFLHGKLNKFNKQKEKSICKQNNCLIKTTAYIIQSYL